MATKGNCQLSFENNASDNGQNNNLNLNKNLQISSDAFSENSKTVTTERKKVLDYEYKRTAAPTKLSDFSNDSKTKKESHSWNKSTKDLLPYAVNIGSGKEDRSKKGKALNASTLSLHIKAYENSNEANGCDVTNEDLRKHDLINKGINEKGFNYISTSVIQNPFEFPRQQENGEAGNPEITHYRASQRLLNPNQMHQTNYQQLLPQRFGELSFMHDPVTMTNEMEVDEQKIDKSNGDIKKKRRQSRSHSPSPVCESGKEKRRTKDDETSSHRKDKDRKEVEKSSSSRSKDKEKDSDRRRSKDKDADRHASKDKDSERLRSKDKDVDRHHSKEKNERRHSKSREDDRRKHRSRSIEREKGDDRHRDSRDRDRRSRKRSTSRDRSRHSSSRDRDYRRRRSPSPRRSRRRSPSPRRRRRSPPWRRTTRLPGPERRDVMYFQPSHSMPEGANPNMSPEERDERTIFILQLARDTRPTDLEEFFASVGNVRDVRIITDSRTGRSKGIAYVEFWERESVPLALGLNKQRLLGAPLIIQQSCAERNRQAAQTLGGALGFTTSFNATGPMKLVVENLHPDINDKMLMDIFEPFGKVSVCKVARGPDRNSLGFANLGFKNADDAKKVLEQMNGYEIAGRALRIKIEEQEDNQPSPPHEPHRDRLEKDEKMELGHTGRLHVMAKLAEGSGMDIPQATRDIIATQQATVPPYATTTFFLSGLFDPTTETGENWDQEIADDVITECNQYGGVWHIFVDKNTADGNVYIKCPTVLVAANCVAALHGRFFAGRMVTANYLPASSYHEMFPESRFASALLQPRR